jgi:hypothetical protein
MKTSHKLLPVALGLCALLAFGTSAYAAKGGIKGPNDPGDGDTTPTPTMTITKGAVTGEAYSIDVDVDVGIPLVGNLASVAVGPVPHAKICPDGGVDESTLLKLNLLDIVRSKTLFNVTSGGTSGNAASVESVSAVEELEILRGLIHLDVLSSYCSSTTDGTTASSDAGSRILGLKIGGETLTIASPANQSLELINLTLKQDGLFAAPYLIIEITDASGAVLESLTVLVSELTDTVQQLLDALLGNLLEQLLNSLLGTTHIPVATLYLNEQIGGGDGQISSSMSNNALRLEISTQLLAVLNLNYEDLQLAEGNITISATQCGVGVVTYDCPDCPECPDCPDEPEAPGFVTGGGNIGHKVETATFASFGFNARPGKGHINVVDHDLNTHIQGYTVSSFDIEGNCATFSGLAKVNHAGGHTYEATVCDNGEPGTADTFEITTDSGYANGGILTGGNIQLH